MHYEERERENNNNHLIEFIIFKDQIGGLQCKVKWRTVKNSEEEEEEEKICIKDKRFVLKLMKYNKTNANEERQLSTLNVVIINN